jgi:hypothetical protein
LVGELYRPKHDHDCVDPHEVGTSARPRVKDKVPKCGSTRGLTVLRLSRKQVNAAAQQEHLAEAEYRDDHQQLALSLPLVLLSVVKLQLSAEQSLLLDPG